MAIRIRRERSRRYNAASLQNAFRLALCLADAPDGLTRATIKARTGLTSQRVQRSLAQLLEAGAITRKACLPDKPAPGERSSYRYYPTATRGGAAEEDGEEDGDEEDSAEVGAEFARSAIVDALKTYGAASFPQLVVELSDRLRDDVVSGVLESLVERGAVRYDREKSAYCLA